MDIKRLKKYAELIAKCGLNVQKGQEVIVRCGLDQPEFVAMCVEECYKCGAERVKVEWSYMPVTKLNYDYRSIESLSEVTEVEKAPAGTQVVEPVQSPAYKQDDQCATQYFSYGAASGPESVFCQGQIGGYAHYEQEEWKDKIAWGKAVPVAVA